MALAKIKDGTIVKYPYGYSDFLLDNNNTNYGDSPIQIQDVFSSTDVAKFGFECVEVVEDTPPIIDIRTHNCVKNAAPSLSNGVWTLGWAVIPKTTDEVNEYRNEMAHKFRSERNQKLRDCDWTQGKDIADNISTAWATYRQALRDIPAQDGFPWNVQWPTQPE